MAEKIVRFGSDTSAEWPLCRMALVSFFQVSVFCDRDRILKIELKIKSAIAITKIERAIAQNNSHCAKKRTAKEL